jgi:hypothetical protein
VNSPVLDVAFCVPPVTLARNDHGFVNVTRSAYRDVYERTATRPIWPNWPNATLPYVRANMGVVFAYPDVAYPRKAVPSDHPLYPGAEVSVRDGNLRIVGSTWTPNVVSLALEGEGGTAIVNRNAQPGWTLVGKPDGVELRIVDGLLAVHVPAGRHEVTLAFRPPLFALGAWLSGIAWLALLVAWLAPRRRGSASAASHGSG